MSAIAFLLLCAAIFLLPLIAESVTSWRAIQTAMKRHPELWHHSGRPTPVGNGNLMAAWPLVRYYRDRRFLDEVRYDKVVLPPVSDPDAIEFAERLRGPLVWSYWAAWVGAATAALVLVVGGIVFY